MKRFIVAATAAHVALFAIVLSACPPTTTPSPGPDSSVPEASAPETSTPEAGPRCETMFVTAMAPNDFDTGIGRVDAVLDLAPAREIAVPSELKIIDGDGSGGVAVLSIRIPEPELHWATCRYLGEKSKYVLSECDYGLRGNSKTRARFVTLRIVSAAEPLTTARAPIGEWCEI